MSGPVEGCRPPRQFMWGPSANPQPFTTTQQSSNPYCKSAGRTSYQIIVLGPAGPYSINAEIQATLDEATAQGQGGFWVPFGLPFALSGTFPTPQGLFSDTASIVTDQPMRAVRLHITSMSGIGQVSCLSGYEPWAT